MNAYPREQPFPRARAVSIEASTGPTNPALASLRTYQLPPYRGAERMMRSYLSEYERMSSGAAIGIRGAFGSGKTHLIHFLMESVRAAQADLGPGHMPVQVYAKATSGDFFEIYRGLISALGAQQLAQAHVKVLSAAGRRLAKGSELFETIIPQTDTPTAVEQLRYTPEMVLGLIRDTLLSESAIVENVAAELRGESSRFTELFSAFTFLNDPALQGTAFSWFQGAPINSEDLKRLGVSAPLTVADANRGLQFISMMYSFAHVPFIIYIDQIERLVLDDVDRREANRGYLHSLIEALVSNRNMLVVAGVSEAWDQLKPDFVQRLSLPPVMMPSLDAKQAQAIIAVWLADDPKNFKESQIFPFSKDSISEIVKLSRGNLRSIISLCFNCFQLARPKELRISLAIVRKAAQSLEALYSRATVLEEIERYLRASRFSFERRATVAGDSQDIVVPNSSAPRVVINVMEPIFLEDEARDAHMHAASAQKLRVEFPKIEYVLVDVGYRSV